MCVVGIFHDTSKLTSNYTCNLILCNFVGKLQHNVAHVYFAWRGEMTLSGVNRIIERDLNYSTIDWYYRWKIRVALTMVRFWFESWKQLFAYNVFWKSFRLKTFYSIKNNDFVFAINSFRCFQLRVQVLIYNPKNWCGIFAKLFRINSTPWECSQPVTEFQLSSSSSKCWLPSHFFIWVNK